MSFFLFMVFVLFPFKLLLVFSDPYYAELPSRITALSGSCVQIPCTFDGTNILNAAKIAGIWTKTQHDPKITGYLMVFNGSTNVTTGFSRIEIVGNLSLRDCTTVFYDVMKNHSDKYYFRVELTHFLYSYSNNPINISVSDVPKPLVFKPTNLTNVMEGSAVNLSCSAEAPCPKQPPTISWSDIPESANITAQLQENPDKTQSVFSLMSFKASYRDHGKNISCTAAYPRNKLNDSTVEATVRLQIRFSPKEINITISPSASVSIGTNVTLICKCKANPNIMNYTWYKREQEEQLGFGEELYFTVNKKSGGLYFCTAKNEVGNQRSEEIQLNVIGSYQLDLIIASVAGVAVFLFLFLLITLFLRVQRVKASIIKETDVAEQVQEKQEISSVYANSAFATDEESETQKDDNGTIQYGEIDFSKPQNKITPANSSGVETVYAEVCSQR